MKTIKPSSWFMLFSLGVIWGTSYILIKRGLEAFTPSQVACLRISITALSFTPFLILQYHQINWRKWKSLFIVGFSGSFLPALLFATAQTRISSALTGILSSLTPLFTLLFGIAFYGIKSSRTKTTGVLLGLAGAIGLLLADPGKLDLHKMKYGTLVLFACAFYAISNNVIKTHLQQFPVIAISAVSYMMVGVPALLYLYYSDFTGTLANQQDSWVSLGYITILALVGTTLASVLFFKLIQDTSALFASTVSYLIPMIAVLWGLFDGESITGVHLVGMAAILTGVYVARK